MLYAELGYSSLFSYCVRELGFAEGAAHILVAKLTPQLETRDLIKTIPQVKLEVTSPGESNREVEPPHLPKPEVIKPITEERVVFKFTGGMALRKKLERAKEILRHKYPDGKLEDIIDEALAG